MPNRLAGETSPYLLQHADNPVDWYPWGEEALARARREQRPILLSIGYSACHWCHVMAHESFADAATAAVMNRHFVNIKVDREERPDLDHVYQLAHQLLQRRAGGWPLTMFLTPDGTPFFGGTYFPKRSRLGLPGFADLLAQIAAVFAERGDDIAAQNAALREALRTLQPATAGGEAPLDATPIATALGQLARSYDPRWGGFGGAPKFPHVADLALLLRQDDPGQRALALDTLRHMAAGGLYDHLGGGFARYSVDERWEIPHFEKMLYDNGPLLALYADAWALTGEPLFRQVAEDTAAWAMREMQLADGGYCASLDADAEGEEGRFYVWTPDAVRALLTPAEYAVAAAHYGLDGPPNFENRAWHLCVRQPLAEVGRRLRLSPADCATLLAAARGKLFAARETRVRPHRDDKVLAAWNGLMIGGMAHAARVCGRQDWLDSAQRAFAFIKDALWRDGRLLASWRDGRAQHNAYLDDHAFLLSAALELLQSAWRTDALAFAGELATALQARFEDSAGAFFFTSHDHETLLLRPKHGHDEAMPSGNGVAAQALLRLAALTGDAACARAAERTLAAFWPELRAQPGGFATLLLALDDWLTPPSLLVLRGPAGELAAWQRRLAACFLPKTLLLAPPVDSGPLPPPLDKPQPAHVNAWLCESVSCQAPIDSLENLIHVVSKPKNVE
ncbi:thioredoxin domain-containing protein [Azospira restricta]|uniref:Thioredoxin domain-containing protein n=1 Tax=Azospira restricta TaxID=404405 RepID=A0A974SPV4_9RHOO|nr:thioredoxin domain-containing protein [Azospira restricta]QRJ64214.1 thioredoxin domain-containing protein [Azospira restricta]